MIEKPPEYTDAEMLAAVRAAIYKIAVAGQSYKIGSRSLTRADLSELRDWEAQLQAKPETSGGFFSRFSLSRHIRR